MNTPVDLDKIKGHLRIPHDLEDEQISDFLFWAKSDVIEAVYDGYDDNLDKDKLELDPSFQKAVIMLTAFFYENRLAISEVGQYEMPFSVTHAIQNLRANRDRYL